MIPQLTLDGITYTPPQIEGLRQPLVAVRDCLLEQGQMEFAFAMSQILALLKHLEENTES